MQTSFRPISSTVDLNQVSHERWDLIVLGAGPAGAVAAIRAIQNGARVLLVDRSHFPRPKVCGCCLNGAAIRVLEEIGLENFLADCGAVPLREFQVSSNHRTASVALTQGVALSRERMDSELIRIAIRSGVDFLAGTKALVGAMDQNRVNIHLHQDSKQAMTSAAVVVAACGLGGRVFQTEVEEDRRVASASRVGVGTTLLDQDNRYEPGTIYMCCNSAGYVGLVRLEDGRLDIAGAVDGESIRRVGSISKLVAEIIVSAGCVEPVGLHASRWQGTPKLTQSRARKSTDRCFFVGDSARYVEPFTGEGMAWAFASGRAVASVANELLISNNLAVASDTWDRMHHNVIGKRTLLCKLLSRGLRHPKLVNSILPVLQFAPQLATPFVASLNRPLRHR